MKKFLATLIVLAVIGGAGAYYASRKGGLATEVVTVEVTKRAALRVAPPVPTAHMTGSMGPARLLPTRDRSPPDPEW